MTYKDISINKYAQIVQLVESVNSGNDIEQRLAQIELLELVTDEDIHNLPFTEMAKKMKCLDFLAEPIKTDGKIPKYLNVGDYRCKVNTDITKVSTSQYIDFTQYMSEYSIEMLPDILTCFLIPDGCEYGRGYDVDDLKESIAECVNIEIAVRIAFFLSKRSELYATILADCLRMLPMRTEKESIILAALSGTEY